MIKGKSIRESVCYWGGLTYRNYKGGDKKSKWTVLCELNALAKYWHCYPETYFCYGMFVKECDNMDLMKTFIPQTVYADYTHIDLPEYNILINDKLLFHDLMTTYGLPTTERFFTFSHNTFKRNKQVITDAEVDSILASIEDSRIFYKLNMCGGGSGVFVADKKDGHFYTNEGMQLTATNIRSYFSGKECLFERKLEQVEELAKFNQSTINTLRVLTYKNKVIAVTARLGRKGAYCDNRSQGGFIVNVDLETGIMADYCHYIYSAEKSYEHPDSHIPYKGTKLPFWSEVIACVEKACTMLPYYNSVGFDVALTPQGPVVIEINTGSDIYVSQIGRKEGLAKAFMQ